jgi:hypothetical protein
VITEYTICALPEGTVNYRHYAITVAHRGEGRWAVLHGGLCLNAAGDWDWEPTPSNRDDDWLDTHRFDQDTALRLAEEQAPLMSCNGITVRQALERSGR